MRTPVSMPSLQLTEELRKMFCLNFLCRATLAKVFSCIKFPMTLHGRGDVCVCAYIYIYTYIYVCMHRHVYIYTYVCITFIFFHLEPPISNFPLIFAKSPYPFPTPCNAKGVFSFPLCVAVNWYTLVTGCIQIKCSPNSETSFSSTCSVRFLTRRRMFSWFSL